MAEYRAVRPVTEHIISMGETKIQWLSDAYHDSVREQGLDQLCSSEQGTTQHTQKTTLLTSDSCRCCCSCDCALLHFLLDFNDTL